MHFINSLIVILYCTLKQNEKLNKRDEKKRVVNCANKFWRDDVVKLCPHAGNVHAQVSPPLPDEKNQGNATESNVYFRHLLILFSFCQ